MKNFEKYEKEIKEIVNQNKPIAVVNNKPCICEGKCTGCKFDKSKGDMRGCIVKAFEWLYQEYKEHIKLSRLEFELLKHFKNQGVYYFAKDKDDTCVAFYMNKPNRGSEMWIPSTGNWYTMFAFKNCFQFVKWEDKKYYVIEDVLNNCEVVEDGEA